MPVFFATFSFPILSSIIFLLFQFYLHSFALFTILSLYRISNSIQHSKAKQSASCNQIKPQTQREREREKQSKMESGFEEKDFLACCGSTKFAQEMALASPFASLEQAVAAATDIWFNKVDVSAWLQAFSAHPQIGDSAPSSQSHHQTTSAQLSFFLSIF